MSWKTIAFLGISAALLGAMLLLGGSGQGPAKGSGRLLALEGGAVRTVKLKRSGEAKPLLLKRHDTGWRMESPVQDRADTTGVERLLAGVEFMRPLRLLPGSKPPPAAGLDTPRITLTLGLSAGEVEIKVGAADVSGEGVNVRVKDASGARLAVAPVRLVGLLSLTTADLRDQQLVPLPPGQIQRVEIHTTSGEGVLERQGAGWAATAAGNTCRAAAQRTRRLLNALSVLRAQRILPAPAGAARAWIRTSGGSGVEVILDHAGACPGRADRVLLAVTERRAGKEERRVGGCVEQPEVAALSPEPWSLQDLRLTRLQEPDLEKVSLRAGGVEESLVRKPEGWTRPGQAGVVDSLAVRAWIKAIRDARARLFAGTTGGEPRARILLVAEAGPVEALTLHDGEGGALVATRGGDGAALLLKADQARAILEGMAIMAR